jgi:uncharacterized repeat protein (TIGR03803 family)
MWICRLLLWCVLLAGCSQATGGTLHGSAYSGDASTYAASPNVARFRSLYSFKGGAEGEFPLGRLLYFDGALYGTTEGGGSYFGTVFKVTTSGKETVLHNFGSGDDLKGPFAGLVDINGMLYGTTEGGGANGGGALFSITPAGKMTIRYNFGDRLDGAAPTGNLLKINGTLYGTTVTGGTGGVGGEYGTVFEIAPGSAVSERVLHSFAGGSDGFKPYNAGVIELDGALYGTTFEGGTGNCGDGTGCGIVYKISPAGVESVLYAFTGVPPDGQLPLAGLVALNGTLYGTTWVGGATGAGTVFSVTPSGTETVLHSFGTGSDGINPESGLIAVNGALYGTTGFGGSHGSGTVFEITPSGTETILYNFSGPDGAQPSADLIAVHGTLYGTTLGGGSSGDGTVFALALQ